MNFVLPFAGGGNPTPFAGVGTYPLGLTQVPWAGCSFYTQGSVDQYFTSYAGQQVGQVVITRFDVATGTAAGTFRFVAPLYSNNSGAGTPTVRHQRALRHYLLTRGRSRRSGRAGGNETGHPVGCPVLVLIRHCTIVISRESVSY